LWEVEENFLEEILGRKGVEKVGGYFFYEREFEISIDILDAIDTDPVYYG